MSPSLLDQLTNSPGQQFAREYQGDQRALVGNTRGIEVEYRSLISAGGSGAAWTGPQGSASIQPASRSGWVTDYLTVIPNSTGVYVQVREQNPAAWEGYATVIAEAAPKDAGTAASGWLVTGGQRTMCKVGAGIAATNEILADAPALAAYIDARLGYLLRVREESQILGGDGSGSGYEKSMIGFLNDPNVQSTTGAASLQAAVAAGLAMVGDYGRPNLVVANGSDFWASYLAAPTFWSGLPLGIVSTVAMPTGTTLVGDFTNCARIWRREGVSIRFGDQHSDYFTSNKTAIIAELRENLDIGVPQAFAKVSFS